MISRDQFLQQNPIADVLAIRGVKLNGSGNQRTAKCPLHPDKTASFSVNMANGTWFCHAGCGGGSVLDLMARLEGITVPDFMRKHEIGSRGNGERFRPIPDRQPTAPKPPEPPKQAEPEEPKPELKKEEVKSYSYTDAIGREVFQVVRFKLIDDKGQVAGKTFLQRRPMPNGGFKWGMEGVERILYRLPEVTKANEVWIVEGEKDADNLRELGFVATCNVGGAGKWLDGYTASLAGKDVILCGDNDKPGQDHVNKVFESIAGKAHTVKIVKVPSPHKDVSDYIAATAAKEPEGFGATTAAQSLSALKDDAIPHVGGVKLPLFSMAELESKYARMAASMAENTLDLSKWLPSFKNNVREIVPGELIMFLGDTGSGKTAFLQNIAMAAKPLPTLMFEMELPDTLLYERFLANANGLTCQEVEQAYSTQNDRLGKIHLDTQFPHLTLCTESKMSLEKLETLITKAELKIGTKPVLVLIDYIQLVEGPGKRYERTSNTAEGLKVLAKATNTIIVVSSQIARSEDDDPEIGLHSGKDSGSIENSAGLVLGAWRDPQDKTLMHLKVLKNTKGTGGLHIQCNFDGARMKITERVQPL